jgi:hypothetical protein
MEIAKSVDQHGRENRAKQKGEYNRTSERHRWDRFAVVGSATLPVWESCSVAKVVSGDETRRWGCTRNRRGYGRNFDSLRLLLPSPTSLCGLTEGPWRHQ